MKLCLKMATLVQLIPFSLPNSENLITLLNFLPKITSSCHFTHLYARHYKLPRMHLKVGNVSGFFSFSARLDWSRLLWILNLAIIIMHPSSHDSDDVAWLVDMKRLCGCKPVHLGKLQVFLFNVVSQWNPSTGNAWMCLFLLEHRASDFNPRCIQYRPILLATVSNSNVATQLWNSSWEFSCPHVSNTGHWHRSPTCKQLHNRIPTTDKVHFV